MSLGKLTIGGRGVSFWVGIGTVAMGVRGTRLLATGRRAGVPDLAGGLGGV